MRSDVTAVIPAKNEAATIAAVVRDCRLQTPHVIVVDGRSTDDTARVAAEAGARVIQDGGRGKGDGIRTAIPAIATPVAVFIDADGSHDARDIPRLIAPIDAGEADHVGASRLMGGSSELHGGFDEFWRLAGSSFITACVNRRFGVRLSDTQNGFRAIRVSVLRELGLREDITTIEQEMVMRTLALGYRVGEIASHESARRAGASHIRVARVAPRYVFSLCTGLLRRRRAPRMRVAQRVLPAASNRYSA